MMDEADIELLARSLRSANESRTGTDLDAALAEIGWRDAVLTDAKTAVPLQFEAQGRANTTSSALCQLVAAVLGADEGDTAVLPPLGRWDPPGTWHGGRLTVDGLVTGASALTTPVLCAVATPDGTAMTMLPPGELAVRDVRGIDPALGLAAVRAELDAEPGLRPATWSTAVDLARLALGHELVGASRAMLELARTHALQRVQFGRPIAAFQAVRHRLAESLVAVEAATATLESAWLERTPQAAAAAVAKAVAGRCARTVARHCQQVLAGIGFTTEHRFHRYLRRTLVLDEFFGGTSALTASVGTDVVAGGRLPALAPL